MAELNRDAGGAPDGPEILYTLVDEDGTEQEFEMIDMLKDGETGRVFCALQPYIDIAEEAKLIPSPEDEVDLVVMEMTDGTNGEDFLIPISDEALFDRISSQFMERLAEDDDDDEDDD